jgi:hypothetical protein
VNLLQKRSQKRPTKIGTRLLGSEMPVPISRSPTVQEEDFLRAIDPFSFSLRPPASSPFFSTK